MYRPNIPKSKREGDSSEREVQRKRGRQGPQVYSVIARKPNTTALVENGCSNDVKHFMKLFTFCIR